MADFRAMILDARKQRAEIAQALATAEHALDSLEAEHSRRTRSLFRWFFRKRIAALETQIPTSKDEVDQLREWLSATHIRVEFETTDDAQRAYASMLRAFDAVKSATRIWDITADRDTDRVAERSLASRTIDRRLVELGYTDSELVQFDGRALRLGNANGDDLLIYPGLILMPRVDGAFAILDLRDVRLTWGSTRFVETEPVPADAQTVGQTWAKVNKDGSPDRRFNNNYAIPICEYGRLVFESSSGLAEEYQVSNSAAALAFGAAFDAYKAALSN